jgi:stage II sporulation protein AA (anti-sigma F factor antagonist)
VTEAAVIVDSVRDDTLAVAVTGEIDMSNASTVQRQIIEAIPNHLAQVTVDLSTLDYIDSAGLRLLFTLGTRLETLQIDLVLVVPTDSPVRRMIDLAGVAELIPVQSALP